jgi:branched-chain amino acid transport system permease protein
VLDTTLLVAVIATAMIYVLSAFGLIVTWRVSGVFNLAFGFQAALAAFLYWQIAVGWGVDKYLTAAIVILVFGPLMGVVIQQCLFRRRREILTSIIVTIGLGVAIQGVIQTTWTTSEVRTVPSLFGGDFFSVGGASVTVNEVGVIASTIVVGALVWLLLNRSGMGLRMRAVVDSPDLAGASGIPYARVNAIAWAVGSTLAAISGVLIAPMLNLDLAILGALVVNAFAVAVFAGLSSLPMAVLGALVLAYVQGLTDEFPEAFEWVGGSPRSVVPFVMLAIVLLVHPAAQRTVRVVGGGMQRAVRERASGSGTLAVGLAVLLAIVAASLSTTWAFTATQSACYALAALSIVLLTGASAQISLAQVTFMGVGAVCMGKLLEQGVPWGVGVAAAAVGAAVAGAILALTAFRLSGLFLALISYAFAFAALYLIFQNDQVIGPTGLFVERPEFLGIDFADERNYLALCMVVLVLAIIGVAALLRGPWGRALQTLTSGNAVADVSGVPVRMWKLQVFVVSSALAGLAGALFAGANLTVTATSFLPEASLVLLVFAVVGGITTPAGAVIAGALAMASDDILNLFVDRAGNVSLILFGLMAMQVAIMYPSGFAGGLPRRLPSLRAVFGRRRLAAADGAVPGGKL